MTTADPAELRPARKPLLSAERRPLGAHIMVYAFVIGPFLALIAAVSFGWGLTWLNVGLVASFYIVGILGVTVGYHRYFTHGAFKANRPLRITLAIAAGFSVQGPIINWVADHRRHHAFSDREGDPHSPWLFGTGPVALVKGFWHAHMGWLFDRSSTNAPRFAPDLLADSDICRVNKLFWLIAAFNVVAPAVIGGLVTWSWWGALTAFFWGTLVRFALMHHVTWSTNSVCHMIGKRPFHSHDRSANFWPLAILSMGESWHNSHHADPTCARHGVQKGQIDISARVIWIFEKLGWAYNVRWSTPERQAKLKVEQAA